MYYETRSYRIGEIITRMFNNRLQQKREKNKLEKGTKLMMNSSYGKLIQRQVITKTVIVDDFYDTNSNETTESGLAFMKKHHMNIHDEIKLFGKKAVIKLIQDTSSDYNFAQCGTLVLSASKHLMNRVMCLAKEHALKIYY